MDNRQKLLDQIENTIGKLIQKILTVQMDVMDNVSNPVKLRGQKTPWQMQSDLNDVMRDSQGTIAQVKAMIKVVNALSDNRPEPSASESVIGELEALANEVKNLKAKTTV